MAVFNQIKISELNEFSERLDPEYYKPNYLVLNQSLKQLDYKYLCDLADITDGSHETRSYTDTGVLFLRVQDIFEHGLEIKDPVYISEYEDKILTRSKPKKGDVLITKTGKIGTSLVYSDLWPECNLPADIAIAKLKSNFVSPYYLALFLNSKFGQTLLRREMSGSGRPRLVLNNLAQIIIPRIAGSIEKKVNILLKECYRLNTLSLQIYPEAEEELLERVSWKNINIKYALDYKVSSNAIFENERIDPEFYQPKFANVIKHLKKIGSRKLGSFCPMPNRGVQPLYNESGNILVINSKHLGPTGIDIQSIEKTTEQFYNKLTTKKARLNKFDVLIYSTGAYIGRTNVYLEDSMGVASNHVTIVRPDSSICNPIYLALFLNSQAGLMQTSQRASGSAQREIYPKDIVKYEIFIPEINGRPDLSWQGKIANKVIKSYEAKHQAKIKFQEAKELIEREINESTSR